MSMFNIGLSGLNTTQRALEVTSHNIANSSTAGYKTASSEFAAVYNGGQRGGVALSGVNENFSTQGNLVSTGNDLDLAITGKGFFVITENGRTAYTQAGQFRTNSDQYIVNIHGNRLQGYGVDENENLVPGILTDLRIEAANIPAQATGNINFALNLSSASDVIPAATVFDPLLGDTYNFSQSSEVFDSLGNSHTLTQYFRHTGANAWEVVNYLNGAPLTTPATTAMTFDGNGQLLTPAAPATVNITAATLGTGALDLEFTIDYTNSTQFGSGFSMYTNKPDGFTSGEFAGVAVAEDGRVYATFTNGATRLQGQVVLASFANVNGLQNGNNTVWYATAESGNALLGTPADGSYGTVLAGGYMGSNVNISEQLVDLMSFQQNYQANAKTISTADEMMQILFSAT